MHTVVLGNVLCRNAHLSLVACIDNTVFFSFQSVYTNISRVLEVADKLSEAVHYESDRIEALAQAVSREWKSFDMNINQRSCLLARSVAYHKHSEEVTHMLVSYFICKFP